MDPQYIIIIVLVTIPPHKVANVRRSNGKVVIRQIIDKKRMMVSDLNVKRNLTSSTSIKTFHRNDKKPKFFSSPNRFATLSTEDDVNDDVFPE